MSFYGVIFYLLAILLIVSTAIAVSRTRLVHAVVYLVISFLATALLFYLLGAPFIAALEVIVYAGAIMVIFLFMIMTLSMEERQPWEETSFRSWVPAIVLAAVSFVLIGALIWTGRGHRIPMSPVIASPLKLGAYVFDEYWFSVEVASFLLFVALVGAMYLGRRTQKKHKVSDSSREAS